MSERANDLIERTFVFAQRARQFVNKLPRLPANYEDARQLVRSSGSVAANYVESQEGLSRRDFFFRIKVCRKEARESALWLRLLETGDDDALDSERRALAQEAGELKRIFSSIAGKDDTG
ncbi:MAG: four helix bundle protein [Opitutaceae bacterium]|jgi:four helix bundle protein|nr:four helix bundle protein [Opitutaceae bacterium]